MNDYPYLSVVATSRNDDHGGNMLRRMQIFVNAWIEQCRRHALASELILVEWNPPSGREPLLQALRWPADPGPCEVRIVTVPERIHRRYRHSESLPLFQMIAKNVGIRRARAPFVLVTNVDILFSDELVAFFASRRLEEGRFYRIDRSDAMGDVPLEAGIVEQLEYCRTHLLRVNEREATFAPSSVPDEAQEGFRPGAGLGLDRQATGEVYLAGSKEATLIVSPPADGPRVLSMLVEAGPNPSGDALTFQVHDGSRNRIAQLPFRSPKRVFVPLPETGGHEILLRLNVQRVGWHSRCAPSVHFRLFECGWAGPEELCCEYASREPAVKEARAVRARDIYTRAEGVSLHGGWGERDFTRDGRLFRRVTNGARFSSYTPTRLPGQLVLELEGEEAGSSLDVRVVDDSGSLVGHGRISRRGRIRVPIMTAQSGRRATLTLLLADDASSVHDGPLRAYGLRRVGPGPLLRRMLRPLTRPRVDFVHTNGCGDFTLMHRDHWFRLRGYPEWEAYSMNIDGVACFAADADGLQEVVLREPMRIYHIEHGLGSGWSPEGEKKLYERITARGITWISKEQVLELARRMYRRGPLVVNDDGWGLGREFLTEAGAGTQAPAAALSAPVQN